jgi:hypothetical protein
VIEREIRPVGVKLNDKLLARFAPKLNVFRSDRWAYRDRILIYQ